MPLYIGLFAKKRDSKLTVTVTVTICTVAWP